MQDKPVALVTGANKGIGSNREGSRGGGVHRASSGRATLSMERRWRCDERCRVRTGVEPATIGAAAHAFGTSSAV
jgi:hypothetical protein